MTAGMREMVIKAMKLGKICAFNMCKSPANFNTEFRNDNFPAETIFDYSKIRRNINDWLTEEELTAFKGEADKAEVKDGFMIVIIFKSENEDDLISGLQGIPGVHDFTTVTVHKSLV